LRVFENQGTIGAEIIKPMADEYRARIEYDDGSFMIRDIYYGSSYLSSSSRSFILSNNVTRVILYSYTGEAREIIP
jgi:hypothetical protein